MPEPDRALDQLLREGYMLMHEKRATEAVATFARATELDPTSFKTWAEVGLAYLESRQGERALTALDRALELDDGQAWVWATEALCSTNCIGLRRRLRH